MRKVGNHSSFSKKLMFSLAFILTLTLNSFAQDAASGDAANGKVLFNTHCAACHKLDGKMTGPPLRGITETRDRAWLGSWIRNSSAMIKAGDPEAVKIFEEYNKVVMTGFPQLSDKDIDDILAYTNQPKEEPAAGAVSASGQGSGTDQGGVSNNLVLGVLALVLGLLITVLVLVKNVLTKIAKANGIEYSTENSTPIWKAFVRNQFLMIVSAIVLLLAGAWFMFSYTMQIGVDQGYEPVQPIHFSHKIHAGENGIDCKYCHSSARTSKTSGIPSLNVCMNCHKNISSFEGSKDSVYIEHSKDFYSAEIQKLYAAVGWDPNTQSYTGNEKPVKWVRVHNLPDFVYFNHSQHVSVAGLECQTCHGPVESMEVLRQHSPLTMGWCVDCHRQTNVKVEGNDYYKKIHEELSKKYGVEKLTAADMGGLECGKCHY